MADIVAGNVWKTELERCELAIRRRHQAMAEPQPLGFEFAVDRIADDPVAQRSQNGEMAKSDGGQSVLVENEQRARMGEALRDVGAQAEVIEALQSQFAQLI